MIAQVQADTLTRALLIALVIVSPYAVVKIRQVRARRAAAAALAAPAPDPGPTTSRPGPASRTSSTRSASSGPTATAAPPCWCPASATVDGDAVPAAVADALVRDALARSGLVATGELDTADGRLLECAPLAAPQRLSARLDHRPVARVTMGRWQSLR